MKVIKWHHRTGQGEEGQSSPTGKINRKCEKTYKQKQPFKVQNLSSQTEYGEERKDGPSQCSNRQGT
jgi:hypothetical protein